MATGESHQVRMLWDLPLTWILLPIKLITIILFGIIRAIRNLLNEAIGRRNLLPDHVPNLTPHVDTMLGRSPIFQNQEHDLYCLRVPFGQRPDGYNHNTDHQCHRQGIYAATLALVKEDEHLAMESLRRHLFNGELRRGYAVHGRTLLYNDLDVSGDQLIGYSLGFMFSKSNVFAREYYYIASVLAKDKFLKTKSQPSKHANFLPGFNMSKEPIPVGAQDLTYLMALKCGIRAGDLTGQSTLRLEVEYWLRFILYGNFLSVIFPTAPVPFGRRNYSNDTNSSTAAFVLYNLSETWFEKLIYRLSILWVWSLSFPWLNGFISGQCHKVWEGIFPSIWYMKKCQRYAFEQMKMEGEADVNQVHSAIYWPIEISASLNAGEFFCDEDQETIRTGPPMNHSTLGCLVNLVWSRL